MNQLKKYIENKFKSSKDRKRNFNNIRALFDLTQEQEYTIDDITWNDLEMNKIYEEVDRTYSTLGEYVLYGILRNPLMDEEDIKERDKIIKEH